MDSTKMSSATKRQQQRLFRVFTRKEAEESYKKAIEGLFDVKVKKVTTLIQKGKTKRFRGIMGKRAAVKKAVITLEEGHTIDVTTGL